MLSGIFMGTKLLKVKFSMPKTAFMSRFQHRVADQDLSFTAVAEFARILPTGLFATTELAWFKNSRFRVTQT